MARTPGRSCPRHYRYSPAVFGRAADLEAQSLYIVGGLYGNPFALEAVVDLPRPEGANLVFYGGFHWVQVRAGEIQKRHASALEHAGLPGDVWAENSSGH